MSYEFESEVIKLMNKYCSKGEYIMEDNKLYHLIRGCELLSIIREMVEYSTTTNKQSKPLICPKCGKIIN